MKKTISTRLISLDVLRGITIAGMMLVNNPGTWGSVYAPLQHATWNGLTPTDLIFPFFMFIMGVSTFISLRKTEFKYSSATLYKILNRTVKMFLIGLLLSWIALWMQNYHSLAGSPIDIWEKLWISAANLENLRILGVMQRLAITYCAVSLVGILVRHDKIPVIILSLLIGYFVLQLVGHGFEPGDQNILAIVDQKLLGMNHMYYYQGLDPEGILSTIPSIAHVLIGFCFGKILMSIKENKERMLQLFIYGSLLTFSGFLLSYACPINKSTWSSSYVLVTCGMAATFLSLLIWIIDVNEKKKWSVPFQAFGANPLFIYVFGMLLAILIDGIWIRSNGNMIAVKTYIYQAMLTVGMGEYFTSCFFAILFVIICWLVSHYLYKRQIFIKI